MSVAAFDKRYADLNDKQRLAVDTLEGPLLVVAGPGSGKTELLSLRVANILRHGVVEASNILCLTFTDAAATNMRQRLAGLIGAEAYKVGIYTFHSYCTSIINRYPEYFYRGVVFSSTDELQQTIKVGEILDDLPYNHPLKTRNKEGYQYVRDILSAISHLKKSGLTPEDYQAIITQNAKALEEINPLLSVFDQTMSMKAVNDVSGVLIALADIANHYQQIKDIYPLPVIIAKQLKAVLDEVELTGKATPLSRWKSDKTEKAESGRILKDTRHLAKNLGLAEVYGLYQESLRQDNLFDYDDMLLDVLQALADHEELRYGLQEQAQYILVDEFQDTNNAQMQLLTYLTTSDLLGGRPNIMAVGDDDQAVYKFQGAEIGNIIDFGKQYQDTQVVVLTHNYRSTQAILDVARGVIKQGYNRLENRAEFEFLTKDLVAANATLQQGEIHVQRYGTVDHELQGVAKRIRAMLDRGALAKDIAVIGRRHASLQQLVPYLRAERIPVTYEKQQNVLQEPHIQQLIQMIRFAVTVSRQQQAADYLLPEILSYPFWGLDRLTVWKVSVQKTDQSWLERILASDDSKLRQVGELLIELGELSKTAPLDILLEKAIGIHALQLAEDEISGDIDIEPDVAPSSSFSSPFREYYFNRQKLENQPAEYLRFLSSLKTFVTALHAHQPTKLMLADDMLRVVDAHLANGLAITDTSPFIAADQSVSLLTAHAAKGLEFETIFVINCQEDVWAGDNYAAKIVAPSNVGLSSAASDTDDYLRLFYVALTRAKRNLFVSSYSTKADGKQSIGLSFMANHQLEEILAANESEHIQVLEESWHTTYGLPFVEDERLLLLPLVEQYKMSVTAFNNFLDVTSGGPQAFLEQNLLRFPQPKMPAASYGTAVHNSIRDFYVRFKRDGILPDLSFLLDRFDEHLRLQWLSEIDQRHFADRGHDELTLFYDTKSGDLNLTDEVEFDFNDQMVMVEHAQLTGKIDRIVYIDQTKVSVHDIKTGHPATDWIGSSPYQKIKLHKYRYQLQFYKLLIEQSRHFGGRITVDEGTLDFVEPWQGRFISLPLQDGDFDVVAIDRLKRLIVVVFDHIQQLNFPDTSDYGEDLKAIERFENDLLEGRI